MKRVTYKTRILEQKLGDGTVIYKPQVKRGVFGNWGFIRVECYYAITSDHITHTQAFFNSNTFTFEDEPRTLDNAKKRIDEFLEFLNKAYSVYVAEEVVEENYIKYP